MESRLVTGLYLTYPVKLFMASWSLMIHSWGRLGNLRCRNPHVGLLRQTNQGSVTDGRVAIVLPWNADRIICFQSLPQD